MAEIKAEKIQHNVVVRSMQRNANYVAKIVTTTRHICPTKPLILQLHRYIVLLMVAVLYT